jgi:hypothetical protein
MPIQPRQRGLHVAKLKHGPPHVGSVALRQRCRCCTYRSIGGIDLHSSPRSFAFKTQGKIGQRHLNRSKMLANGINLRGTRSVFALYRMESFFQLLLHGGQLPADSLRCRER